MKNNFITYAHRGASAYAPDNTFCSFYLGLLQGANGIETDVRMTKDNVLVLFHDDLLEWHTSGRGNICDYTLEELNQVKIYQDEKHTFFDRIITFEDFLKHFYFRDITFAIEIKQRGIAKATINMLEKYNMCDKTIVTSFDFENIRDVKEYMPEYRVGWLIEEVGQNEISKLHEINAYQICPMGEKLTKEWVDVLHKEGFNVRAWGIFNEDIMKYVYDIGVDGMTVNFPDKLLEYIGENQSERR